MGLPGPPEMQHSAFISTPDFLSNTFGRSMWVWPHECRIFSDLQQATILRDEQPFGEQDFFGISENGITQEDTNENSSHGIIH